jgi:hypothetical protein
MGIFRRILRWIASVLRGARRTPAARNLLEPIDTGALAVELKLEARGAQRGCKELPSSDNEALDNVEQEIIQRVEGEWLSQGDAFLTEVRAYDARLASLSVRAKAEELRLAAANAMARFHNATVKAKAELGPLQEQYIAARRELEQFRKKHGIDRPAHIPSQRKVTLALLVVLIGVESLMNAVFFQKGSEYGFIGGVGIAIVISFFNIALAFLLGLGPARWIKYRNFALRAFAFITFLVLGIILISLHAFAAHYREAMLTFVPEDQAFIFALDTLTRSPLRLHELSTVYLFGLGILFAILSAWKGYQFDDPYPWYGVTQRRYLSSKLITGHVRIIVEAVATSSGALCSTMSRSRQALSCLL